MKLTPDLIHRYNVNGPRYTSYPTAPNWHQSNSQDIYQTHLHQLGKLNEPISLYIHIPFCEKQCYFCGCNVIIKKQKTEFGDTYLNYIEKECQLIKSHLGPNFPVHQIHIGGGTPTYLSDSQLNRLDTIVKSTFNCAELYEYSIEIDPRLFSASRFAHLNHYGVNRLSFGIQDFDPIVQRAINRDYNSEIFSELLTEAHRYQFSSINVDLIYGLPYQTTKSFSNTVSIINALMPDRIALYSFAYLPQLISHHKLIRPESLPSPEEKVALYLSAKQQFESNQYLSIAMDHFALENDELSIAFKEGRMARNFMGYTTLTTPHYLGIGVSAIGYANNAFFQNTKDLKDYYACLDNNSLPIKRQSVLSSDDLIRQWVIFQLMCAFKLDKSEFYSRFQIDFDHYFHHEQGHLSKCETEKLITNSHVIVVSNLGKLFIRNICMGFDNYLPKNQNTSFSKTI